MRRFIILTVDYTVYRLGKEMYNKSDAFQIHRSKKGRWFVNKNGVVYRFTYRTMKNPPEEVSVLAFPFHVMFSVFLLLLDVFCRVVLWSLLYLFGFLFARKPYVDSLGKACFRQYESWPRIFGLCVAPFWVLAVLVLAYQAYTHLDAVFFVLKIWAIVSALAIAWIICVYNREYIQKMILCVRAWIPRIKFQ